MTDLVTAVSRDHRTGRAAPLRGIRATRPAILLLAATLVWSAAGPTAVSADEATRVVTDMAGHAVRLPAEVTRVVGTGGAVDEWVLLLGSPGKLVATSDAIRRNPWYARIYPAIRDVPAPLSPGDVNVEALLARRPQAAILLSGMPTIDKIRRSGIPTVVLERRDPEELKRAVTIAAAVLGPQEQAAAARFCSYYDGNIRRVTARTAALPPERRLRVYYASSSPLTTEGRDTLVTAWIAMAGGRNVAAVPGIEGMGRKVSMEDVVAWDPQVIIAMQPAVRDEILASDLWRTVSAVRDRRVYVNPRSVYSWGIRSADEAIQVLWAAKTIHPELFPDLDMVAETRSFHRAFYHVALSDDEARRILAAQPPP